MTTADVVVVGGGVMGGSAAWALARRGREVTLLEQFAEDATSRGDAEEFRLAYPDPFHVGLARRALTHWRLLEAETGSSLLDLTGAVDHGPVTHVVSLQSAMMAAGQEAELVSPVAATQRWQGLRFDSAVLFHRYGGRIDADGAVTAFTSAAAKRGATVRHGVRVIRLAVKSADTVEVVTEDETVTARRVVVTAGAWTAALLGDLAAEIGVPELHVTREQPVRFPVSDVVASWPSVRHHVSPATAATLPPAGAYGCPSPGGVTFGLPGTGWAADPAPADAPEVDPERLERVQEYVRAWVPGVDADAPAPLARLDESTVDADFVVDAHGPLVVAAGFSGHGFKFAPVVGDLVADLVAGVGLVPERFRLGRERVPA